MDYKYTIVDISEDWETWYKAIIPAFPKLFIVADDVSQLHDAVCNGIDEELAYLKSKWAKIPLPDNVNTDDYSWNFVLRIKPELHKRLAELSKAEWYSLNKYISNLIESN